MEIKHKECFCPAFIDHTGCQPVHEAAREVWEFVNLYSKTRGCNRFLALQRSLDLLRNREDIRKRNFRVPAFKDLDTWIRKNPKLGNPDLTVEIEKTGSHELKKVLEWSIDVNKRVADRVSSIPPFPFVKEVLQQSREMADLIVISQTPVDALAREWKENEMDPYIELIAGQEHGTKTDHIRFSTEGKGYSSDKILMVGDAPGDLKAAIDTNVLFYPIIPGREEVFWKRFAEEGLLKFFEGTFAGAYQQELLKEFDAALPATPLWK